MLWKTPQTNSMQHATNTWETTYCIWHSTPMDSFQWTWIWNFLTQWPTYWRDNVHGYLCTPTVSIFFRLHVSTTKYWIPKISQNSVPDILGKMQDTWPSYTTTTAKDTDTKVENTNTTKAYPTYLRHWRDKLGSSAVYSITVVVIIPKVKCALFFACT